MPEQISRYPDVTLEVLKGAGGICGAGAKPQILTQCPAERFCAFPSGEICVYGLDDIPRMTQIKAEDLAGVASPPTTAWFDISASHGMLLAVLFGAGLALGRWWPKRNSGSRADRETG